MVLYTAPKVDGRQDGGWVSKEKHFWSNYWEAALLTIKNHKEKGCNLYVVAVSVPMLFESSESKTQVWEKGHDSYCVIKKKIGIILQIISTRKKCVYNYIYKLFCIF